MGRLKFEKEFKEKLDRRELKPSENSWEKLNSQLDSEEKSSKFNLWWIGIAATILAGILIIGLQYRNSPVESTPQVVDAPEYKVETQENENLDENSTEKEAQELPVLNNENTRTQEAIAENREVVPNKKSPKSNSTVVEKSIEIASTKDRNTMVASSVAPKLIEPETINSAIDSKADFIITQKLSEVIAQVNNMNSNGNSVSDSEVDKLLAQAARQIEKERDYNFSVGKIDPDDLLQSVEMDMEYSFREKIFDVLKEGYLKAKTAVANRNY